MLRFLGVRHLAVIDALEVEFEPGLNVLTGETGAGKSILVEAIGLLTGGRASADLVRAGESTATVQAVFEAPDGRETIVRREVSAQGRSRAFLDDTLATTTALRDAGQALLDLYGQHEHHALTDPAEQLAWLDAFGGHAALAGQAAEDFGAWRAAAAALERTRLDEREKRARLELATLHLDEIRRVAPHAGEDAALAAERTLLANQDRIQRLAAEAYDALYEGDHAALGALATVWKRLGDLTAFDPALVDLLAGREEVTARLDDVAAALRRHRAGADHAPGRLQAIEERLSQLERLKRRHGPALDDVLARARALADEVDALDDQDRAAQLERAEEAARTRLVESAAALTRARRDAAPRLADALSRELSALALPQAVVELRLSTAASVADWSRTGADAVEYWFAPNPGEPARPLARIASGGELSRVMLALRSLAARDDAERTLVFDEVDAGIGGEAADAVGRRLQALATRHQVLCITHLPQIAARAGTHVHLVKTVRGGRTATVATRLDEAGRVEELGRMIAGAGVSAAVLASAREMLKRQHLSEQTSKGESEAPPRRERKARRGE
jgi:DNA repair protein RecN (Recombination protein N)